MSMSETSKSWDLHESARAKSNLAVHKHIIIVPRYGYPPLTSMVAYYGDPSGKRITDFLVISTICPLHVSNGDP